jgi:hypothetical protein
VDTWRDAGFAPSAVVLQQPCSAIALLAVERTEWMKPPALLTKSFGFSIHQESSSTEMVTTNAVTLIVPSLARQTYVAAYDMTYEGKIAVCEILSCRIGW